MIIKKIKINQLKPAPWNPRTIDDASLKSLENSLKTFGYLEPIIWNEKTGNIVGGHQRFNILSKTLKPTEDIEVVVVDLDEQKEKALNLALNKISGEWEEIELAKILDELNKKDANLLSLTGFQTNEINNILSFVSSDMPKIEDIDLLGKQTNIQQSITFYFNKEKDYNLVKKFFNSKEPDSNKLIELIKRWQKNIT